MRRPLLLLAFATLGLAQTPRFEVISIRPTATDAPNSILIRQMSNGVLNLERHPLTRLLELAFGAKAHELPEVPKWVTSARYDINAKASTPLSTKEMWPLLRAALQERFQLKTHREAKQMPVFRLVVATPGKLTDAKSPCLDANAPVPPLARPTPAQRLVLPCDTALPRSDTAGATLAGSSIRMTTLASALTDLMGRPVVDRTGITGTFDIELKFDRDDAVSLPPRLATTAPTAPTITTALLEQLGLKLESAREPVEVIVIDHIEQPSEN